MKPKQPTFKKKGGLRALGEKIRANPGLWILTTYQNYNSARTIVSTARCLSGMPFEVRADVKGSIWIRLPPDWRFR